MSQSDRISVPARSTIREALHTYQPGDLVGALVLLDRLPGAEPLLAHPAWEAGRMERLRDHGAAVPAAVLDWVELARDRIRAEAGLSDVPGAVPVGLAISTALDLLGPGS